MMTDVDNSSSSKSSTSGHAPALTSLDGKISLLRALPYGVQHVLAMFVANLAPIFLIASGAGLSADVTAALIQNALLIAGLGTIIQLYPLWRIGSGLPIVTGVSFTYVAALATIIATQGFSVAMGAIIAGGLIEGILGLLVHYWRRFISPIVSAVVVTSIGFSLLSVGAESFGGGSGAADFGSPVNLLLGTVSLVACIAFQCLTRGPLKQLSVLFGLVVGYLLALPLGMVDFSQFEGLSLVSLPHFLPFVPEFRVGAIVTIGLLYLVSAVEVVGDTSALALTGLGRPATRREIGGSIAGDGVVSTISGFFGCLPITSFAQNIGLVAMTKVVNRKVIATGAGLLILAAFFPPVAAVFSSLPDAVLGGCTLMMFGNIALSGFQMIARAGFTQRTILIAALSLAVGIGFTQTPGILAAFPQTVQDIFASNCIVSSFVVALIANLLLPSEERLAINLGTPPAGVEAEGTGVEAEDGAHNESGPQESWR